MSAPDAPDAPAAATRLSAALDRLVLLEATDVHGHVTIYEQLHADLQAALATVDGG